MVVVAVFRNLLPHLPKVGIVGFFDGLIERGTRPETKRRVLQISEEGRADGCPVFVGDIDTAGEGARRRRRKRRKKGEGRSKKEELDPIVLVVIQYLGQD